VQFAQRQKARDFIKRFAHIFHRWPVAAVSIAVPSQESDIISDASITRLTLDAYDQSPLVQERGDL
jgi:hypothetical protein